MDLRTLKNMPQASIDEVVHGNNLVENCWRRMPPPMQKSVAFMAELQKKFLKPGDFVLKLFAVMRYTAKLGPLLNEQR